MTNREHTEALKKMAVIVEEYMDKNPGVNMVAKLHLKDGNILVCGVDAENDDDAQESQQEAE